MMERAEEGSRNIEAKTLYNTDITGHIIREGPRYGRKHTILHREPMNYYQEI
jgi:hypothetical protein